MVELTGGESLAANKLLLLNNARLAAQIAVAFKMVEKQNSI
jgi:pseudouridine-5'-phosphate glycosidase